jgi:hypothetical protein
MVMPNFRNAALAGIVAAVIGCSGAALAQSSNTHTLTVQLPGGGIAEIHYTGNVAPQVTVSSGPAATNAPGGGGIVPLCRCDGGAALADHGRPYDDECAEPADGDKWFLLCLDRDRQWRLHALDRDHRNGQWAAARRDAQLGELRAGSQRPGE